MTATQIDAFLRRHTPVGTSQKRVIIILDSLHIEHSAFDPRGRYVLAMWKKTSRSMFEDKSIQVRFFFDESGSLLKYELKELATGT